MSNLVIPVNLQWVGGAKETTYGVAPASPTFWVPVDGSSLKYTPGQAVLTDGALRGVMAGEILQIAGMRSDTLAYKSYVYTDSVFQHFLAILGKPDAVTGSADPWTHKTSLENGVEQAQGQPPSFTLWYFDGLKTYQITGCVLSELKTTTKVDELATVEATWMGLPATILGTAPTNGMSTVKPIPAWSSSITIGGSTTSLYSSIELDYKRDAAAVQTINNSQSPLEIFSGTFTVSGTLTAVYQGAAADVNITDYLANTQPALTVKLSPVGDATHYLQLQHSKVAFDAASPQSSNKWMEVQATVKALANVTDALDGDLSPAQVTFLSSQNLPF